MNKSMHKLLMLLAIGAVGSVSAKHNVYLKVKSDLDYNFDINGNLKNDGKLHLFLERKGDTDVLLGNLNDLKVDTFTLGTPLKQGGHSFSGFSGILTGAYKHMAANPDKDFLITINAVGGHLINRGKWDVKGTWVADHKYELASVKLINASNWNLEIKYTEEMNKGYQEVTEYLIKTDYTKVNFVELADATALTAMKLQGKSATPGTWTGWAMSGAGVLNSSTEDITTKVKAAISKITDSDTQTIAVIVKHVGRSDLVGPGWDVKVEVVKQSDKIEDLAAAYSITPAPGTGPVVPGKPAGKPKKGPRAPALTAYKAVGSQLKAVGDHLVAIQNNSDNDIKVFYKQGDKTDTFTNLRLTNATLVQADKITQLTFTDVTGMNSTYNATPMLKHAMTFLDPNQAQYIVFNVRHIGKNADSWVVKVKVLSYKQDDGSSVVKKSTKQLTYKHGGKIKQK